MTRTTFVRLFVTVLVVALAPPARAATPIAAADNVDTAIAISKARHAAASGINPVILTRSDGWTDALSAGAVAGRQGTVVLLNPPGPTLDPRVEAELDRLGVGGVWIAGGTAAVSTAVEDRLRALGYSVTRYAGADRVATSVAMADNMAVYIEYGHVFLTRAFGTGTAGFADALGGGLLAGHAILPLVVTETERLSPATKTFLEERAVEQVTIIGGSAAVSDAVASEIAGMDIAVDRIAGPDRFETAELVARAASPDGVDPSAPFTVVLVDGMHPDAWAAGFPGATFDDAGAIMLTNGASLPAATTRFLEFVNEQRGGSVVTLLCAPQVTPETCNEADSTLNG